MQEIVQLFELQYSDLLLLSGNEAPASEGESRRLEFISEQLMLNLGPHGPGLVSINGVPDAGVLSQALLPLARKLALLGSDDRKRVLKEHNLGSDVSLKNLDRIVSSFAMQMRCGQECKVKFGDKEPVEYGDSSEFHKLGVLFQELGSCMMELGLLVARICDERIGGCELENSLLQCGTAKGRLIHYHSLADNVTIKKEAGRKGRVVNDKVGARNNVKSHKDGELDMWQNWHYDYGIFTILTVPIFMLSNGINALESDSPVDHTYLQILQPEKNHTLLVNASKGCIIVQVGESATVLSKGKLRATLHCVAGPAKMDNLSRETFVLFLQPAWNKIFSLSDIPSELITKGDEKLGSNCDARGLTEQETDEVVENICKMVPPLFSRLRDGMTFAEFSKETTKQYYGGGGLQSN